MFGLGIVLGVLAGGAAGAVLGWALLRGRFAERLAAAQRSALDGEQFAQVQLAEAQAHLVAERAQIERLNQAAAEREAQLEAAREAASSLKAEHAALAASIAEERRAAQDKLDVLQRAIADQENRLRDTFAALSSDALRRNNQSFLDLARETLGAFQKEAAGDLERRQQAIGEIVRPVRESLAKVDEKIRDIETARVDAYSALNEQVRALGETQQHLYAETSNLVKALRAPNVRGRWGEIQLRRVVEMAGMLEHCDFSEQQTSQTEDGRIRPDLVVRLPGGKVIVVDAKTPLDAYISAVEAPDDATREGMLKQHARQVRDHITKLSGKQYWGQFSSSPEFVFMFLPGEPFFAAALQHDPALIEFGVEQRVIPASPTTLIALLRAVAYGWRQEQVARNAQQISELGRQLYDRLHVMAGHFEDVRRNLDRTVEAYNKTAGSLESRVMVSARRFGELGVLTQAELPELAPIDRGARALQPMPLLDEPEAAEAPPEFLSAESGR